MVWDRFLPSSAFWRSRFQSPDCLSDKVFAIWCWRNAAKIERKQWTLSLIVLSLCFTIYISARCAFVQRNYDITLHECILFAIVNIGLDICLIVNSFASVSPPPSASSALAVCYLGDCLCLNISINYSSKGSSTLTHLVSTVGLWVCFRERLL